MSTTVAAAILSRDRIANCYALADLEPPFEPYTTVATATRRGEDEPAAACLILRAPDFTAMVSHGDPDGLAAILDAIDLPPEANAELRAGHVEAFERHYALDRRNGRICMALTRETFRPLPSARPATVRLSEANAPALLDLYAEYDESFFQPAQLRGGVFFGVHEGGRLLAAAGTHVVARRAGIAVVGNVYTRPEARGRGHGAAVTAAVVAELLALPMRDVALNVAIENATAIGVYQRLGFEEHSRYWAVRGRLRR